MYTNNDLALVDNMNKQRLREACKAAAIKNYSKMTVEKMREALRHHIGRALVAVAPPVMETAFQPIKRSKAKDTPAKDVVKAPRPEANGIKMPGENTKCRAVWDWADKFKKDTGNVPDAAAAREWAEKVGANVNNALIELSQWKRFHGLTKKDAKAA